VNVLALYDIHGNIDALEAVPAGAPDDMPAVTAALSARELGAERAGVLGELPPTLELDGALYEDDCAARRLWVADGVPELRSTSYDGGAAGCRMLAAGRPDELSVNSALISPVPAIEITRLFEARA
jgi:hypothetical protein